MTPMERTERRALELRGTVQGVGLRPAIYRLALELSLGGFVRNEPGGVRVEVEGPASRVRRFRERVETILPPPARVEVRAEEELEPASDGIFRIGRSIEPLGAWPSLPPDLAPCEACLAEIGSTGGRRSRHPFVSCTACGPRFSVACELVWDRARTTMAPFGLCAVCTVEYRDPADRRFHAETIACNDCGPALRFLSPTREATGGEALDEAVAALRRGQILAVKGIGGYLLACDATDERAVALLRRRKHRPEKPFAVAARDLREAERVATLDPVAAEALVAPARPIVIVPVRGGILAPSVAPGLSEVGIFLPPSPLQWLLLAEGPSLQVMTSGNRGGEPIAIDDEDALRRLAPIADAFLLHDRAIARRLDDSVVRPIGGRAVPIRRARGYVPTTLPIAESPPILAVGADGKNTVCLAVSGRALLSSHVGDLEEAGCHEAFELAIADLLRLSGVAPERVVTDLHPDSRAAAWAARSGIPSVGVQHHQAHFASCLAENEVEGPAIGVVFDGTGYGYDGTIWGGEFLVGDLRGCSRAAHLLPLPLPGGEAAIRQPWRIAVAALHQAGEEPPPALFGERRRVEQVLRLLDRGVACPRSTGAGRYFDAVAALCGLCESASFDGQAAMLLEAAAAPGPFDPYPFRLQGRAIDLRPTFRAIASALRRGTEAAEIAARFHETMARAVASCCEALREEGAPSVVALSGGCFQNRRLAERVEALLVERGFEVFGHRLVPPNDGGIAYGQAAVVAARMAATGAQQARRPSGFGADGRGREAVPNVGG